MLKHSKIYALWYIHMLYKKICLAIFNLQIFFVKNLLLKFGRNANKFLIFIRNVFYYIRKTWQELMIILNIFKDIIIKKYKV